MISRYTVHVDGRHDPIAVRDRLHGCLSEWEVVADVHVTAGDGRYTVHVDWDIDHPDWADECWPMHAADALGHAAERVDGVTDAVVVCHDQPEPTTTVVDASPPRPPYRLPAGDQGGAANGTQIAVDGRSGPDAAPTMGEPSQGLSDAPERPSHPSRRPSARRVAQGTPPRRPDPETGLRAPWGPEQALPHTSGTRSGTQAAQDALSPAYLDRQGGGQP